MEFLTSLIKVFGISMLRYFVIAGIAFFLVYRLYRSKLVRNKIQKRLAARADFMREIFYSIQTTVILGLIACIILYTPLIKYTRVYTDLNEWHGWYLPLSVIGCLVIHDTYFYWMHRLLHHPKIFRATHLVHHRSVNPSPWASYSFHFLEAWTEGGVLIVIVLLLPVHPIAIAAFTVSAFIINVYGHLGYEIVPKGFRNTIWFGFFNTSVHHNLHHSKFKGNYGLYFRVWDRLMGTEHPEYVQEFDRIQARRFGETTEDPTAAAAAIKTADSL